MDTIINAMKEGAAEIERLRRRVAELETERRWIPVEESLPETAYDVEVKDKFGNQFTAAYSRELGMWEIGYDNRVTHWRYKIP